MRATDQGDYANHERKCGKVQKKTVFIPSDVPNSTKIYVKNKKRSLRPGRVT